MKLTMEGLKRLGVVMKRAQYFIIAADLPRGMGVGRRQTVRALIDPKVHSFGMEQMSLFDGLPGLGLPPAGEMGSIQDAVEEAVACLAASV